MKTPGKILLITAILYTITFSSFAQADLQIDSSRIVKVLTFNIYHGEKYYRDQNKPYENNLDAVSAVINELKPDLVAMQEVDFKTKRVRGLDLMTEFGIKTNMVPLFGKAMKYDGGEYGEGILSRYSFAKTKNYPLTASQGKEPRAALCVYVELPCGELVRFVGTHLDHTSGAERLEQAKELNSFFANDDIPTILVGDLNAKPDSETMQTLFRFWKQSAPDNAPTIPSINPKYKIDYILYKPENRWRVIENKVIDERVASDHNPVFTVFELLAK